MVAYLNLLFLTKSLLYFLCRLGNMPWFISFMIGTCLCSLFFLQNQLGVIPFCACWWTYLDSDSPSDYRVPQFTLSHKVAQVQYLFVPGGPEVHTMILKPMIVPCQNALFPHKIAVKNSVCARVETVIHKHQDFPVQQFNSFSQNRSSVIPFCACWSAWRAPWLRRGTPGSAGRAPAGSSCSKKRVLINRADRIYFGRA